MKLLKDSKLYLLYTKLFWKFYNIFNLFNLLCFNIVNKNLGSLKLSKLQFFNCLIFTEVLRNFKLYYFIQK